MIGEMKRWGNPDPIVTRDSRDPEVFRDRCFRLVLYVIDKAGGDVIVDQKDIDAIPLDSLLVCTEQPGGKLRYEMRRGAKHTLIEPPDPERAQRANPWLRKGAT